MNRKSENNASVKLTLIFIITVLAIMSASAAFTVILTRLVFLFPYFCSEDTSSKLRLAVFIVVWLVTGTAISAISANILLKPLGSLFTALKRVASENRSRNADEKDPRHSKRMSGFLYDMTEELNELSSLNADFASNFSHEFKTPVTSIHGFAKLIKSGGLTPEKNSEYIDIIISETERLAGLSESVLLFTKTDSLKAPNGTSLYNLTEQLREAVILLEGKWSAKNIVPTLDGDEATVTGNRELLSHVWINILDNAIKFSGENAHIRISVASRGGSVTVRISDNGMGMDENTRLNIFTKYFRGGAPDSVAGSGLGMPTAKKIVELHNGTISVKSTPGRGTQVSVTLPGDEAGSKE